MRTKILLFFTLFSIGGFLSAQDTIRTLIISEARYDEAHEAYCELTNVGTDTVALKNFEFGVVGAWDTRVSVADINKWFVNVPNNRFMLPDWKLAPGKSIVIANVYDWNPKMWFKNPDKYVQNITKPEMWKLVDIQINLPEALIQPTVGDSVSRYSNIGQVWGGRDCWYLRYHNSFNQGDTLMIKDSIVVDQVGGVFDETDGTNAGSSYAVAGIPNASVNDILVRKFSIKKGNIDFAAGRGTSLHESEWIPIQILVPGGYEPNRALFWTVKNHVNAVLDPATLVSTTVDVNWTDSSMTVPWGIRDDDSIMYQFERKPGLAWRYDYAPNHDDSAYVSIRTGDILTLDACGDSLQSIQFKLKVAAPTADAGFVIPKKVPTNHMYYTNNAPFCTVSDKVPGMDTISNIPYGIPFATRVDTLYKYLEKAPLATWEIIWVDGNVRPDLKYGDVLKVTAENGSTHQYFIKVAPYKPSHNAYLGSITWPDIPDAYRGFYGWNGDTIPAWAPSKFNYIVQVPAETVGIPALIAKNEDVNASFSVQRASNLLGTTADRTITFTSTAEDGTTVLSYKIELDKLKAFENRQQWAGDPFISQYVFQQDYNNYFLEVVNPGTASLDFSHYMFVWGYVNSPAAAITEESGATAGDWKYRYKKYIPGYKWDADSDNWKSAPALAIQDIGTDPNVKAGDVWVGAAMGETGGLTYPTFIMPQVDIDFLHNPWGEDLTTPLDATLRQWWGGKIFIFKILNDSIRQGIKPATDPNDFQLVDCWASVNGTRPVIGGTPIDQDKSYFRKSYIFKGDTVFDKSFGTTRANSEWYWIDESILSQMGYFWPYTRINVADGIGSHFMNEVTIYKSTISSLVYRLTDGFSFNESLWGIKAGSSIGVFESNIIKADTGQTLTILSHVNGAVIADTSVVVVTGDTLMVVSNDKVNTTKYALTISDLSSDAVLTSSAYNIDITGATGTISGFPYGKLLKDVVDSVTVPAGARLDIIDANGAYVSLKTLNFDTIYVDTKVTDKIYFEVTAENGITKILYQLIPTSSYSDAFVISDVYMVDQTASLISGIPFGTTIYGLFRFLTPAPGATMKLVDKYGFDRTVGFIAMDDKLVVTSADQTKTKVYYLNRLCFGCGPECLAYVLSDVYVIDQVNLVIEVNYTLSTLISDFLANLTASPNATTIKVVTALGVEDTGALKIGDKVRVTACDGVVKVDYLIFTLSVSKLHTSSYSVYPNPSSGDIAVEGLAPGNKIVVSNILGQQIFGTLANKDKIQLSLTGQPAGIYFIQISNDARVLACFKLIIK